MLRDLIDFDYILNLIYDILAENKAETIDEILLEEEISASKRSFYVKIGNSIQQFFFNKLYLRYEPPHNRENYDFIDFKYNKMVCLDFLSFCIDHRKNLRFDLCVFKNEEDKKSVLEYVKNNLYIALSCHNPKKTKKDIDWTYKYELFRNTIKKRAENFVFKTNNCEYILPVNHFDEAVFYHKYGISELPDYVKEKLANKDFIDAGAFIGDSALIFNKLKPRKIYAFEPSRKNYFLMQKTISLNGISNVVPVRSALGDTESSSTLFTWGNASFISEKGNEEIETSTIDCFQGKSLSNIGLIKMDIEGFEFKAIQGAEKTIKNFKPVLIISLYHRGRDFFEIPRMLKEWVPSYNFRFLNLNRAAPILEKVLLAY